MLKAQSYGERQDLEDGHDDKKDTNEENEHYRRVMYLIILDCSSIACDKKQFLYIT